MKKLIAVLCLLVVMASMLTACKFTCDLCGEEKTGKQTKGEVMGEEVVYCKECKEDLDQLKDAFGG